VALVPVPKTRARVIETSEGLTVSVPARKNWFMILFLGFWMIGWTFGEVVVIAQLVSGKTPGGAGLFVFAWLGGWTVGGAFAGYAWAWSMFGVERLLLRSRALVVKRDLLGLGREREYDLAHVTNLRAAPVTFNPLDFSSSLQFWGIGGGTVAFDYGAKTFRFGAALDEAEAAQLVQRLKERHAFR
jgi:hypothetical protein